MGKRLALTGDMAAAESMRQINPDVVAAYPITPQTEIMMTFSQFVADGLVDTELVRVDSEHSAMSACVGSAAAGARTMTATAANGLALMHEVVYIAASTRLPIVMPVVNRALSAPINIHCDHSDTMAERDSGWIQIFSQDPQEVYDHILLALKLSEHPDVLLPTMVNQDGFITSHGVEPVEILDDSVVKTWIGDYKPKHTLLDFENPITVGPLDLYDYYFEHKRQQVDAIDNAFKIYPQVAKELSKLTKREYPMIEQYNIEKADHVIVTMASAAGTTRYVVDQLTEKGEKVGLLKIRLFRPFPADQIVNILKGKKSVAVLDRSASFGSFPPLAEEIRNALYDEKTKPPVYSFVFGLGGRDLLPSHVEHVFKGLAKGSFNTKTIEYLGVR
ncbi:MAG: pyruvate ferredoxin oxidoreductase [Spirochaetes bacterium]|nr:pyruvate ferredoxin oxidoreductase [Spirochaetota bacterium]